MCQSVPAHNGDRTAGRVDGHGAAIDELAAYEQVGDPVVHFALDEPSERARAVFRLVAVLDQPVQSSIRRLE